ncbi:MAG: bifunctional diaminohydroxyphosphoribosylaminopyrimidine deaminase/5-amino-6-(5-phosphoribosylamino)uracil reductase RibD, partial [Planctomycetes bacterium]|nr:bifunctional diaminohydroxyphosphoribosylaminopyrimidine deaminase/5-amino-6-(5-phosphoribosylamino)uracil reductase RibD [Planctomycetota bacterium]
MPEGKPAKRRPAPSASAFMMRAIDLADRGIGFVSPNPPVGAVAVRDGEIVAEGYHHRFGAPHAEANLIASVPPRVLVGADLYVTLEPCAHHGKTPPCTDAIIDARFRSVTYGVEDPNPLTRGKGPTRLRTAGIEVECGVEAIAIRRQLAPYLRWIRSGLPLVTAKWAMTADGRIATSSGDARWISSEAMLDRTRAERGRYDAILIGSGTQRADDPRLTSGGSAAREPLRVLLSSSFELEDEERLPTTIGE